MSLLVDDRDLLRGFRAGDASMLRRVFEHYAPGVARMLRLGFGFNAQGRRVRFNGLRETFDLEDIVQDTFRRAFSENARDAYDGLRPYQAYLNTIARNVIISAYQQNARRLERFGFDEVEDAPDTDEYSAGDDVLSDEAPQPSGRPERDAEARELHALVTQYRDSLSEREARVYALRFAEGLSHTEITEKTGISPSKIKTAEARIRKGLLRHLHRNGYLEGVRSAGSQRQPGTVLQGEKP